MSHEMGKQEAKEKLKQSTTSSMTKVHERHTSVDKTLSVGFAKIIQSEKWKEKEIESTQESSFEYERDFILHPASHRRERNR